VTEDEELLETVLELERRGMITRHPPDAPPRAATWKITDLGRQHVELLGLKGDS